MTKIEIVMVLTTLMSITWAAIVTIYALQAIKKHKMKVDHYQQPKTQVKIAQHVIKNQWYKNGGEVFK